MGPGEEFGCSILAIETTGRVAAATIRETSHDGDLIDYFHSSKIETGGGLSVNFGTPNPQIID
jgi:hypothetical protein